MNSLKPDARLVLIGASTGGPGLIERILAALTKPLRGSVVIAQHMDQVSLVSFVKRLHRVTDLPVLLSEKQTPVSPGHVYLLKSTARFEEKSGGLFLEHANDAESFYNPTIDKLFFSAAPLKRGSVSAYLLSGIGYDGAEGLLALKRSGHRTTAQDEESSIVYGMPKRALELNAADRILSIGQIAEAIKEETCFFRG